MFDPSKLNLDLDENNDNNDNKVKKETIKKTLEKENILEDFNNPILEKEEKEKKIEEVKIEENNDILLALDEEKAKDKEEPKMFISLDNTKKETINKADLSTGNVQEKENKIIYDVNITKLEDILDLLVLKEYDFVTLEPNEKFVKITFRKDKVIIDEKYIKYHLYSNILIKLKLLTKLKVEETEKTQEGSGETIIQAKTYKVFTKIVPNQLGENIFIKIKQINKQLSPKEKKKISLGQMIGFLGAGLFAVLIIGGAFLAFILLNSNNIGDLTFFNNLGVNVGSIKEFTAKLVDVVFFSILLIETGFLFTFIFKATLTKKEFKQKKIARIIISIFFLFLTMLSGFLWLTLSKKITNLKGLNYGKIEYYDNSKYLNDLFDTNGAKLNLNNDLIGPVTIRFNIEEFMKKLKDDNFKAKKITWIIGKEKIKKPIEDYELIKEFNKEGLYNIKLEIEGINIKGETETITKELNNVNIETVINITERKQKNGGSIFDFDASNLKNIGKIKWYYIPDVSKLSEEKKTQEINKALSKEVLMGYLFTSRIIFEEEVILGMKIITNGKEKDNLDKIFIISKKEENSIKGKIVFEQSIINPLKYTFKIQNANTNFGDGTLEEFIWNINGKEIKNKADLNDLESSSQITYTFKKTGNYDINVILKDSRGQIKELNTNIHIEKKYNLLKHIQIYNNDDNELITNVEYNKNIKEYLINEIGIPTTIKLDARFVKLDNPMYTLNEVKWDYDSDGDFEYTGRVGRYDINTIGNHQITVEFKFKNRNKKLKNDIITIQEKIFIEGIEKEAIIKFNIKKDSNYIPAIIQLDASKSMVSHGNIAKFIWDYGDGIKEERDSIVKGHKYIKAGDYTIKLEIVTEDGKKYSTSKNLTLLEKPQSVVITPSMKSAPINQGIDFLSTESEGQVVGYFWDFGDGTTSTEANPTHKYKKIGNYDVKLQLDFANNNILDNHIKIKIYKD